MGKAKIQAIRNPVQKLVVPDKHMFFGMYYGNSDIQACVSEISKRIGVNGLYFDRDGEDITNNYLEGIKKLFDTNIFKIRFVRDISVVGIVYISPKNFSSHNSIGVPGINHSVLGWNFHDPRGMRIDHDRFGNVTKYVETVGGYVQEFTPDQMAHFIIQPDIDNEVYGLSKLSGLALDVLSDSASNLYNYRFFQNGMSKDIIVSVENGINTQEGANIKNQFTEDNTGDNDTARGVIVTNGIKEIIPVSGTNKDAQFMDLRKLTTEKVCSAFGVPKSRLGYTEGVNYATAESQYKSYIDGTIRPMEKYVEEVMNDLIFRFIDTSLYANNIFLKMDGDNYEDSFKIHEDQRADLQAGILSVEEIKLMRG